MKITFQLWQSEGLDLYIIPYGCVATGNEMGMIEVVQDAETVAKVMFYYGKFDNSLIVDSTSSWREFFHFKR